MDTLFDLIGNWNPQLLRELRGRLKWPGILLSIAISAVFQVLFLLVSYNRLPHHNPYVQEITSKYCTGEATPYGGYYTCIADGAGGFLIDWRAWWFDSFHDLGVIVFLVLAVAGVYMLVNDLHRETKYGTLNFIRLSPTSGRDILRGKMLGVPILLYFVVGLTLPLHLWAGVASGIPITLIGLWYAVVLFALRLFYSAAALFALSTSWLNGIQPWIGSATMLIGLFIVGTLRLSDNSVTLGLNLLNPVTLLSHLAIAADLPKQTAEWLTSNTLWAYLPRDARWFSLPIGLTTLGAAATMMLNSSLWSYWIWRGLERNFRNPNATLLSKRQSYGLVLCIEGVMLGFVSGGSLIHASAASYAYGIVQEFVMMFVLNLLLLVGLIVVLSPHRQTLHDWARYRHQFVKAQQRRGWNAGLLWDLVWGEKSPALLAIALNIGIITAVMLPLAILHLTDFLTPKQILIGFALSSMMILIYGAIAQLTFLMQTPKRMVWGMGSMATVVIVPFIAISIVLRAHDVPSMWLMTAFPWTAIDAMSANSLLLALAGQMIVLSAFTAQITRQLRYAGESETKALLRAGAL